MEEITIERILDVVNGCIEGIEFTEKEADESLIVVGMDSILFIKLIVTLEEEFGCIIPDSKLLMEEMDTLNKILSTIRYAVAGDGGQLC